MNSRILPFLLAAALLATAAVSAAAAPAAGPCLAGGSYDPACDVDRNGVIDILDIQLTAGRWNTNGVWTADGWSLTGNAGTTPGINFLGTTDNQALELKVNGQRALRLEPNASSPNLLGGYAGNTLAAGVVGAAIGGGGSVSSVNRVTDNYGVVGGGEFNTAGNNAGTLFDGAWSTVGGGYQNVAGGLYATVGGGYLNDVTANYGTIAGGGPSTPGNATTRNRVTDYYGAVGGGGDNQAGDAAGTATDRAYATVSGGIGNTASGYAATIGGGSENDSSGSNATVSGGFGNSATGSNASVPGGQYNEAVGSYSFAAGQGAKANHEGSFVWNGTSAVSFASSAANEFTVNAANGTRLVATNSDRYAVYALNYGTSPAVYADTAGTNAGYFLDNIFVGGNCTGCELVYVARNGSGVALEQGDVVAAAGIDAPLAGTTESVLLVRPADSQSAAVLGVVQSRARVVRAPGDQTVEEAAKAEGVIQPGDYLFIVVQGLAQVKVETAVPVQTNQRLTVASTAGRARVLRTIDVEGIKLDEGGPVIGVTLGPADPATGLAPVMVTLR